MGEIKAGKVEGSPVRKAAVLVKQEDLCSQKLELVKQEEVKKGSKGW